MAKKHYTLQTSGVRGFTARGELASVVQFTWNGPRSIVHVHGQSFSDEPQWLASFHRLTDALLFGASWCSERSGPRALAMPPRHQSAVYRLPVGVVDRAHAPPAESIAAPVDRVLGGLRLALEARQ